MLFTEVPFPERFKAAAGAGFDAVEFMFPYEFKASDIVVALKGNGLDLVLHNLPAGDWASGDRGIACDPSRVQEFRNGVEMAIDYAQALGCPKVNCLAGKLPMGWV
jgi:hydroxypyruvate isomerase